MLSQVIPHSSSDASDECSQHFQYLQFQRFQKIEQGLTKLDMGKRF